MQCEKRVTVKLNGFSSSNLKTIEKNICLDSDSTLASLIRIIQNKFDEDLFGSIHEYNYRFQANIYMVFVDNCYIGQDKWESFVPKDGCTILIVPPFSDG